MKERHVKSSIRLASHTPPHDDGGIHQWDTVTFAISGSGVISMLGTRDGQTLASWSMVRGDLDCQLSPSAVWLQHPGPLHVKVMLREQAGGSVKTVAETSFEVVG